MWFTSDSRDLHYGKTKWEMTDSGISENKINHQFDLPILKSHIGKISLLISDLKFAYGNNELIFNKFSNNISDFRCLGIVGNNGSGKSTLASLLLNIEEPISGLINLMINESNVPEIGYLDQFPEKLLGIMTINDFLNSLLNNSKLKSSNIVKFKSDLKSNNIDWDLVKNKTRFELSWTELRFILVCILSNCNYDLLILDEPTFGMGNKQKLNLHSYFVRYLNKKHLILISHDKSFVNSLCDSIIKL